MWSSPFAEREREIEGEYVREREIESYASEVDNDLVLIFGICPMRKQDLIEKVCGYPVKAAIRCKEGKWFKCIWRHLVSVNNIGSKLTIGKTFNFQPRKYYSQ